MSMKANAETVEQRSSQEKAMAAESAMTRLMGLAIGGIGFFIVALKLLNPY